MASNPQFEKQYKNLNPEQKKAVDTIEGPVLVVAGPGSGKTQILSLRVANILNQTHMRPSNILCLTFTDSAAVNMRKRLIPLLGTDAYRVAIHTFHNFCVDIIGKFPEFFYNGASFSPADELVQIETLEKIFADLAYDNPLKSIHPEEGYVYLKDVKNAIGNLKKAGITPSEFEAIIAHNEKTITELNPTLSKVFSARVSSKSIDEVAGLIATLQKTKESPFPSAYFQSFKGSVIESLQKLLVQAELDEKPSSLVSEWKKKRLEKGDDEEGSILKETRQIEKLKALGAIYRGYKEQLLNQGYYDFDDMILDVIVALESNEVLRAELQEQFQYVLVDEFQDTNDAQMRLLKSIIDAPVHEGRPNVMVVGDDDQAIYKFQGAEIANILHFKRDYADPVIVTMTKNYRSTQDILNVAQHVIRKGTVRLEKLIPNMEKTLTSENKTLKKGSIIKKVLPSTEEEYHFVASEIRRLIDTGVSPAEIAVIARKHDILERSVPHLQKAGVPIRYERQQNVLDEPHIHQIIQIARFAASCARKNTEEADNLLPEILSYPFWGIPRLAIWNVSIAASKKTVDDKGDVVGNNSWIHAMGQSDDAKVKQVADFLLDLSIRSLYEPLEYIVDRIVGAHVHLMEESEDAEVDPFQNLHEHSPLEFHSPFKSYYFSKERFDNDKGRYLTFLSSLRVFMQALREYRQGEILKIEDLVSYVDIHKKNGLLVTDNSPYISALSAVSLLTAHKSKGLEFEVVFVLSCEDSIWIPRAHASKLPMPLNLAIMPGGDEYDDKLRLFFVAITRAKSHLYLTAAASTDGGNESLPLQFIADAPTDLFSDPKESGVEAPAPQIIDVLADSWRAYHRPPTTIEEKILLSNLIENYQMSVTHLNNFLDVTKGGPQAFLELNLLRFPQAKTPSASYGTAIHKSLENIYTYIRKEGILPTEKQFLQFFTTALKRERLGEKDYAELEARGTKNLSLFFKQKNDLFKPDHKIEVNFKNQGVVIEEAHLAGKIDKIESMGAGVLRVHDFKTGGAVTDWTGKGEYEKIKIHNYQRQLVFYKLLVEHARDYMGTYRVTDGMIEFVEAEKGKLVDLPLIIDDALVERTKKLIGIVYKKIIALDFPDIREYPENVKGIIAFEDDLLSGSK